MHDSSLRRSLAPLVRSAARPFEAAAIAAFAVAALIGFRQFLTWF